MQQKNPTGSEQQPDQPPKKNWLRKVGRAAVNGLTKVVGQGANGASTNRTNSDSILAGLAEELLVQASTTAVQYVNSNEPAATAPSVVKSTDPVATAPSAAPVVKSSDLATTVPLPSKEGSTGSWLSTAMNAARSPLAGQLASEAMAAIQKQQNATAPVMIPTADQPAQEIEDESLSEEGSDEGLAATLGDVFGSPAVKLVLNAGVQAVQQRIQPTAALTQRVADQPVDTMTEASDEEHSNEDGSGDDLAMTLGNVFGSPSKVVVAAAVQTVRSHQQGSEEGDTAQAASKEKSTFGRLLNTAQNSEFVKELAGTVVKRGVAYASQPEGTKDSVVESVVDTDKNVLPLEPEAVKMQKVSLAPSQAATAGGLSISTQAVVYGACAGATLWLLPKVTKPLLNIVMNETAAEVVSTGLSWCAFFAGSVAVNRSVAFYNQAEAKQAERAESVLTSAPKASIPLK